MKVDKLEGQQIVLPYNGSNTCFGQLISHLVRTQTDHLLLNGKEHV